MKLYDLVKDRIKEAEGIISDREILAINRRDFLFSETSFALVFLKMFSSLRATYEMFAIIDFVQAMLSKSKEQSDVIVHQLSQSMTLASLATTTILGDDMQRLRVFSPRGIQKFNPTDNFASEIWQKFNTYLISDLTTLSASRDQPLDIIFCNATSEAEVISGIKYFQGIERGFIVIKGYGRVNAPNCGEVILDSGAHVHCSLAGFGFAAKY